MLHVDMDGTGKYWQIISQPDGECGPQLRQPSKHDGESHDLVGSDQRGERVHVYSGAAGWVANATAPSVSAPYHVAAPVQHPHLDGVFRAQLS